MRVGVDLHIFERGDLLAGERIELDDRFDLVAEEVHPPGHVLVMRGEDLQIVAAHPEIAAREGLVVALVLERDELADDLALVDALALLEREGHRRIGLDRADAVDARDRGDDDDVVALEQRPGRGMAHPVDRLVHRAFLLDVGVGARHIGLGLVIIVIGDEELDRIVGEEARKFAVELGGEDLVGREHERRALQRLDHLGHGVGLARAGDAEQDLGLLLLAELIDQFGDRRRLVARRLIIGDQPERLAAFRLFGAGGAVGDEGLAGLGLFQAGADGDRHGADMVARAGRRNGARLPPAKRCSVTENRMHAHPSCRGPFSAVLARRRERAGRTVSSSRRARARPMGIGDRNDLARSAGRARGGPPADARPDGGPAARPGRNASRPNRPATPRAQHDSDPRPGALRIRRRRPGPAAPSGSRRPAGRRAAPWCGCRSTAAMPPGRSTAGLPCIWNSPIPPGPAPLAAPHPGQADRPAHRRVRQPIAGAATPREIVRADGVGACPRHCDTIARRPAPAALERGASMKRLRILLPLIALVAGCSRAPDRIQHGRWDFEVVTTELDAPGLPAEAPAAGPGGAQPAPDATGNA